MQIKRLIAALATGLFAAAASATLDFAPQGDHLGRFEAITDGELTLTYLGGNSTAIDFLMFGSGKLSNTLDPGASFTGGYLAGEVLPLVFGSLNGSYIEMHKGVAEGGAGFVVLGRDEETPFGTFDYVLGFSNGGQRGFDDMRVGVNAVAAVPEPEVFALMLAGIGAVAFAASRRAKQD